MKFDELRRMVSVDMKIDGTELDIESLKTPQLHNKYLNLYHDERLILKQMRSRIKELVRDKWEFYSGKMSEEKLERLGWEPFQLKVLKQDIAVGHQECYRVEKVCKWNLMILCIACI